MNGARDEACKQADGHDVPVFTSCTFGREHTHTHTHKQNTLKKELNIHKF